MNLNKKPETKVIGLKVVNIKGVNIEVRLLEVPHKNYNATGWTYRICPKCRFIGNSNIPNQNRIRRILRK